MKLRTIAAALVLAVSAGLLSGCQAEEPFYSPGYWREDTYYSAFLGLRFTLSRGLGGRRRGRAGADGRRRRPGPWTFSWAATARTGLCLPL